MDFKSMNPLGIIGVIGAIILVIGVFLDWIGESTSVTGWDIYNDWADSVIDYTYAPLLCLVVGILSIILMIMPIIMNNEKFEMINNILGLITLILSIVAVIVTVLFWQQDIIKDLLDYGAEMKIGFWLCLVGAIITLIGGLMPVINNKLLKKN